MHLVYISKEQVQAHLRELASRLRDLGADAPSIWIPVGRSGARITNEMAHVAPDIYASMRLVPVHYDRPTSRVIADGGTSLSEVRGKNVIICDAAVLSGASMLAVADEVRTYGPAATCSYSMVLKRGSRFIPSLWSVLIGDADRAYFLRDEAPNNRLSKRSPYLHIRKLAEADGAMPLLASGVPSIDRVTWADRYFAMATSHGRKHTYLLEVKNQTVGFVSLHIEPGEYIEVDEVVVLSKYQSQGYGGALLRWSETLARHHKCERMQLWGITDEVPKYEKLHYRRTGEDVLLDKEHYFRMEAQLPPNHENPVHAEDAH